MSDNYITRYGFPDLENLPLSGAWQQSLLSDALAREALAERHNANLLIRGGEIIRRNRSGGDDLVRQFQRLEDLATFARASRRWSDGGVGLHGEALGPLDEFQSGEAAMNDAGALFMEGVTNHVRNPRGEGTGGSSGLPNNWGPINLAGLTMQPLGQGYYGGRYGAAIRFHGTTTGTGLVFAPETTTQIVASTGQTWTHSAAFALIGGSAANVTGVQSRIVERTSGGGFLASGDSTAIALTRTLSHARLTRTLSNASTERVRPEYIVIVANGAAVDFTIFITSQITQTGYFPGWILPPAGSPGNSSTLRDNGFIAPAGWMPIDASGLTVLAEFDLFQPGSSDRQVLFSIGDGTTDHRIQIVVIGTQLTALGISDATGRFQQAAFAVNSARRRIRAAAFFSDGNVKFVASDGVSEYENMSITPSAGLQIASATQFRLGAETATSRSLNGRIRELAVCEGDIGAENLIAYVEEGF